MVTCDRIRGCWSYRPVKGRLVDQAWRGQPALGDARRAGCGPTIQSIALCCQQSCDHREAVPPDRFLLVPWPYGGHMKDLSAPASVGFVWTDPPDNMGQVRDTADPLGFRAAAVRGAHRLVPALTKSSFRARGFALVCFGLDAARRNTALPDTGGRPARSHLGRLRRPGRRTGACPALRRTSFACRK